MSGFLRVLTRFLLALCLSSGAQFLPSPNIAEAHGGGLDSDGGHNCYVSYCAGTYHCHQARGPRCQPSTKPQVTFKVPTVPQSEMGLGVEATSSDDMGFKGWALLGGVIAAMVGLSSLWNRAKAMAASKFREMRGK